MTGAPRTLLLRECAFLVAFQAAIGLALALWLHHTCTSAPSDVSAPVPGTPRANYCASMDSTWLFVLGPAAGTAVLVLAARRRPALVVWGCLAILLAAAVLAGRAGALDYSTSL